jgi:hypothetical protein
MENKLWENVKRRIMGMPTNAEIAGWLREAAKVSCAVARFDSDGNVAQFTSAEAERRKWLDRANQVEKMRCEECKWSTSYPIGKTCPGVKFSCGHWEGKDGLS